MSQDIPLILISPEAHAALAAEVERGGSAGLTGGLLFGYAPDERHRLVVSSVRLGADVGFGQRDFALDQTRTSRQLEHAQSLDPQATYCGVWYLHRTPERRVSDAEWVQMQTLLEDPDFRCADLVCLVLCFYYAELTFYAYSFTRHHSARGQAPAPAQLKLTTEWMEPPARPAAAQAAVAPVKTDWYTVPQVAVRLNDERQKLAQKYRVEPALAPDGQLYLRLSPQHKYDKMAFYLALGPGFPDKAPHVFLLIGGRPQRITCPALVNWSADRPLVKLADELVEWLAFSAEEYLKAGENALNRGGYQEAIDLLKLVLSIDPRTPGAARLLAKAQASTET